MDLDHAFIILCYKDELYLTQHVREYLQQSVNRTLLEQCPEEIVWHVGQLISTSVPDHNLVIKLNLLVFNGDLDFKD